MLRADNSFSFLFSNRSKDEVINGIIRKMNESISQWHKFSNKPTDYISVPYTLECLTGTLIQDRDFSAIDNLFSAIKKELGKDIHLIPLKDIIDNFLLQACQRFNKEEFIDLLAILKKYNPDIANSNYQLSDTCLLKVAASEGNCEVAGYLINEGDTFSEANKSELINYIKEENEKLKNARKVSEFIYEKVDLPLIKKREEFIEFLEKRTVEPTTSTSSFRL